MSRLRISALAVALVVLASSAWWWDSADDWAADITVPPDYPRLPAGAEPNRVAISQLPPLNGHAAAKPVVCADHLGYVLVVSYGTTNPFASDMLLWRSADRGESWLTPANLTNGAAGGSVYFDPWLETDRRGRFYFAYGLLSNGAPLFARSRDAGITWQLPTQIGPPAADRTVMGASPDGRLLVVAAAMSEPRPNSSSAPLDGNDPDLAAKIAARVRFYAGIFLSTDYGGHWRQLSGPFGNSHAIPFAVVVDNSGRIAAAWIVEGDGSRSAISVSRNRGQTWSETKLAARLQPDRSHAFNGERFPVVAVDGQSGLQAAYVTAGAKSLAVTRSDDWEHWETPVSLSAGDAEEVRMAAIDARGPMVHASWMERRGDVWHAYYCGSKDRGRTWSTPLCVSRQRPRPDAPEPDGFGIYSDDDQSSLRDDGLGRVHLVWTIQGGTAMHAIVEWRSPDQPAGDD